jgi:transposase-like protein
MATHVTHFMVDGHLACGRHGDTLVSTTEAARVKCRNCRVTEAFREARRIERNAARRAARKATKAAHAVNDWRAAWVQRLTEMPGLQRLPRGFKGQPYV